MGVPWTIGSAARRNGRPTSSSPEANSALAQDLQSPFDPPRPGLRRLGGLDRHHVATLVAVGQLFEPGLLGGMGSQGGGEVGWDFDLTRRIVDFQRDLDFVAARDASAGPRLGAP